MSAESHSTVGPGMGWESGEDATPGPVIDALSSVRTDASDGNLFPKGRPPSFGELRETCGDDLWYFCEDCAHPRKFGQTCQRSTCPRCWASWVIRTCNGRGRDAPGVVASLEALRKQQWARTPEDVNPKFHHNVFSPPPALAMEAENPREKAFEILKEALDAMNIPGAYIVYHPWRGKDEIEKMEENASGEEFTPEDEILEQIRESCSDDEWQKEWQDDDRGEWPDRLGPDRSWEGDVEEELVFSPHFHVLCVSDFVKGKGLTEYVHEETGWVIHRITGGDSKKSIKNLKGLAGATTYCLSHAEIYENSNGNMQVAARRVGDLHGIDVFDKTEEDADEAVREVAPYTLGVPVARMACDRRIPANGNDGDADADQGECEQEECEHDDEPEPEAGKSDVTKTAQAHKIREGKGTTKVKLSSKDGLTLPRDRGKELPTVGGLNLAGSGTFDAPAGITEGATGEERDRRELVGLLGLTTEEDEEEEEQEYEVCNGAYLNIGAAPAKLEDEEWVKSVPYAADLIFALEEAREEEDWID